MAATSSRTSPTYESVSAASTIASPPRRPAVHPLVHPPFTRTGARLRNSSASSSTRILHRDPIAARWGICCDPSAEGLGAAVTDYPPADTPANMVFSSPTFLFLFLPLTLLVYLSVPAAWRNGCLLVA